MVNSTPTSLGARRGQKARRLVAVEGHVGIGEVADHHEAVAAGQLHHLDEELRLDRHRRRIVRIVDDQQLRPGIQVLAGVGDVRQELFAVGHFQRDARCPTASATAYTWTGKYGAGTIAVSPGPISARHMWLKPSFEPRQTITSLSGSSRTPYFLKYLLPPPRGAG